MLRNNNEYCVIPSEPFTDFIPVDKDKKPMKNKARKNLILREDNCRNPYIKGLHGARGSSGGRGRQWCYEDVVREVVGQGGIDSYSSDVCLDNIQLSQINI